MSTPANGRVVVVTGANEGIGYHLLRTLLMDGYRVAGLDVDGSNLQPLADAHDRAAFFECDVRSDDDVAAAIDGVLDEWGHIDVLVNNAAIFDLELFERQDDADLRDEFEVNYFGYLRLVRAVLPHMRARGEGIIHNVSSGVAFTGHPGLSGYAATKGAIEAFTKSLRMELQHEDVAVTRMHPPATNTRSAAELEYPSFAVSEPEEVGRKLAKKIESTRPVIYADWQTRIGMYLVRRFPYLAKKGTERFVPEREPEAPRAKQ